MTISVERQTGKTDEKNCEIRSYSAPNTLLVENGLLKNVQTFCNLSVKFSSISEHFKKNSCCKIALNSRTVIKRLNLNWKDFMRAMFRLHDSGENETISLKIADRFAENL